MNNWQKLAKTTKTKRFISLLNRIWNSEQISK